LKSNQKQKIICRIILILFTCSLVFGFTTYDIQLDRANISEKYSKNISLDENLITIGYDLQTKTEIVGDKPTTNPNLYHEDVIAPYLGNLQEDTLHLSYPFPPDDRVKVVDTTTYPWSTICKLYITAADSTQFIGSGTMLDEYHVLTCGHCVYLHGYGGWASEVKVIPGMAGDYEPFGHAFATYYRSYTEWTEYEMYEHDWAVITLDRTIGSQTGWMGRMTADPSDPVYTGTLNIAGYPGDLDLGEYMYFDSDVGEYADEYNHWFWMDTAAGQSGSPVWMYDGENRYIVSINAYEYEYGTYANFGTRLNQDKYDRINTWLAEDVPPNDGNPDDNSNLDYIIPIIITIVVIALIGITIIIIIKRKIAREREALETTSISPQLYQEPPLQPELSQPNLGKVKFCPMCGKPILRETQKFCQYCGFHLKDEIT
jgi:glutamyl endopeptidase